MSNRDLIIPEADIRNEEKEALDRYQRGLDESPIMYQPSNAGVQKAHRMDGTMAFVASEESPDRRGDVIQVGGWQLKDFAKNPVFLYSHDMRILPLGTVPWTEIEGKQLLAGVAWDEEDAFAEAVKAKYDRGTLRAVSVGFRPIEFRFNEDNDGITFFKQELVELSAVAVPMHPKALRKMLGAGTYMLVVPEIPKTLEIPPLEVPAPDIASTNTTGSTDVISIRDAETSATWDKLWAKMEEVQDLLEELAPSDDTGAVDPEPDPEPVEETEDVDEAEEPNEETLDLASDEDIENMLSSLKEEE